MTFEFQLCHNGVTRVTDSLTRQGPDGANLPELPADGLVLWRVSNGGYEWWCSVEDFGESLSLRVHSPNGERTVVAESHDTAAAVVARADELRAQCMDDGWELVEETPLPLPIMKVWLTAPDWVVSGVTFRTKTEPELSVVASRSAQGLLAPGHAAVIRGALDAALCGQPETVYFKVITDRGLDWRRCLICRDGERVRMDIYEASEAEAVPDAVEVDLRA